MTKKTELEKIIIFLLLATALTPLIITSHTLYPFIFGKIIFFRVLVETAFLLFGIGLLFGVFKISKEKIKEFFKNPLVITLGFFLLSIITSTLLAGNTLRAFWGGMERGGGLFGMLHYFVFLGLALAIFSRKDWIKFFKIFLLVGFVEIFYGFLQFFGVGNFPFALEIKSRIGSFIENPAFFAAYLFFVIISAVIVWWSFAKPDLKSLSRNTNKFWKYISVITAILSIVAIFMTGTRGALVGLGTGILFVFIYLIFSKKGNQVKIKNISAKKISVALLIFFVIFGGFFLITKNASFWQKVPGLNRLAQTQILSVKDTSTQTRLITWGVSWEAFKEKPVFGWGPEHYITAYSKHYNPDYAIYGETWLDRAHNKVFDLLVMQGIIGLLAYLGVIGVALFLLLKRDKKKKDENNQYYLSGISGILISGLVIGYFVQNLFLFDDLTTYISFFALIGAVFALTWSGISRDGVNEKTFKNFSYHKEGEGNRYEMSVPRTDVGAGFAYLIKAAGLALVLCVLYSLYNYNLVPYVQAKLVPKAEGNPAKNKELLIYNFKNATKPYTFIQPAIIGHVIDYYYDYYPEVFGDLSYRDMNDCMINKLDEVIEKNSSHDPRLYIRKGLILNIKGKVAPSAYKEAEEALRKAIKLAPQRQEGYYTLSVSLLGQNKKEEAVEVVKYAFSLSPEVPRAHYQLSFVLFASNKFEESIEELDKALEMISKIDSFQSSDLKGVIIMYSVMGEPQKSADVVLRIIKENFSGGLSRHALEQTLYFYSQKKDKENFLYVAERTRRQITSLRDQMDIFINLAENEHWDVLNNLIKVK